jgi:hypothetical protein
VSIGKLDVEQCPKLVDGARQRRDARPAIGYNGGMTKTKSWQSKLLDEPRMGFVEEHGFRPHIVARPRRRQPEPVPEPIKYDPLMKIVNEPRIGFDTIHLTSRSRA